MRTAVLAATVLLAVAGCTGPRSVAPPLPVPEVRGSPDQREPVASVRRAAEQQFPEDLAALAAALRAVLGPAVLTVQVDRRLVPDCHNGAPLGTADPHVRCGLRGRVVAVLRDATFRADMVALDRRLRRDGWSVAQPSPELDTSLSGVMRLYWDKRASVYPTRDVDGDARYSIGDLPDGAYQHRGHRGVLDQLNIDLTDRGETLPPLVDGTPVPVRGLDRPDVYALVLSLHRTYFDNEASPSADP